jgi:hypothetical protein
VPVLFTLEALEARHGDALLLHFGTAGKPRLAVIDGGPAGVYRRTLKPRLEQLRARRAPDGRLEIRLVMISHMDDDHIHGVLQMLEELDDRRADRLPIDYDILGLWHNSFDDILGNETDVLTSNLKGAAAAASAGESMPADVPISRPGALLLASVKQGRQLRAHAEALSLDVNQGFSRLVGVPEGAKGKTINLGSGLSLTVLGPNTERIDNLRKQWDAEIKKLGIARQAAFVDESVFNLSSIVVVAKAGARTVLLTGDARGDDILAALKQAKLFKQGRSHFDIMKVPHHGSDRNVETDFFRAVTADHYVISGNGGQGNPEISMLNMLSEARPDDGFTVHLTNVEPRLTRFFDKEKKAGRKYRVVFRAPDALSLKVELGEKLKD